MHMPASSNVSRAPSKPCGLCGYQQVYSGLMAAARGIMAQGGPRGLYRGLGITLVEIVPYSALQFGLYDSFNSAYNKYRVRASSSDGLRTLHAAPQSTARTDYVNCGGVRGLPTVTQVTTSNTESLRPPNLQCWSQGGWQPPIS